MGKENEGNVYTKLVNFFIRHPEATVTVLTLFAFILIGAIICFAPQFGKGSGINTTSNSLKFDAPSGSQQNQGAVEGANTQSYGPQEQSSDTPSGSISETPIASDSATPTETPMPTSSPTSAPTATPEPTAVATETPAPTATLIPTVILVPTSENSPSPSE